MSTDPRGRILFTITSIAVAVLLLWTLYLVRDQLVLVYISGLLATGLAPLVLAIERQTIVPIGRKRLPRAAAILAIYALFLAVVGGVLAAALPPLIAQAEQLWKDLPAKLDTLQMQLVNWGILPAALTFKEIVSQVPAGSAGAVGTVLIAVWSIIGGLFGLLSILLLTFYLLVEWHGILNLFIRLFPRRRRRRVTEVSSRVAVKISAWLGGQLLLGLIIGVTSAIGLALLGVPYFFVLAVIAGIGEMIPMVGPILSAVPAVAVALTISPGLALAVAVFFIAQQVLENNVLVPKVLGSQVGLSAVAVIIALGIGTELLGILGALLAVPTAAIVQVLVEELLIEAPEEGT
ncbi:MAG: AI-2E family transporter [Vicinamibacterales bacterium]